MSRHNTDWLEWDILLGKVGSIVSNAVARAPRRRHVSNDVGSQPVIDSVRGSEIGSLDGRVVCACCREHIVVDSGAPRSVVGFLRRRDGRWRLGGIWCARCVPVVRHDHGVVVGVVLSKSQHRSPSVSSVTLLSGDERV